MYSYTFQPFCMPSLISSVFLPMLLATAYKNPLLSTNPAEPTYLYLFLLLLLNFYLLSQRNPVYTGVHIVDSHSQLFLPFDFMVKRHAVADTTKQTETSRHATIVVSVEKIIKLIWFQRILWLRELSHFYTVTNIFIYFFFHFVPDMTLYLI